MNWIIKILYLIIFKYINLDSFILMNWNKVKKKKEKKIKIKIKKKEKEKVKE